MLELRSIIDGILVVKLVKKGCESMAPFQNIVTKRSNRQQRDAIDLLSNTQNDFMGQSDNQGVNRLKLDAALQRTSQDVMVPRVTAKTPLHF